MKTATEQYKYNAEADHALGELYSRLHATTNQLRIQGLQIELGGDFNYYAFGGEINDEMKLACLEYEYLQRIGKIDLALA
ncbi:MAG: hypothetical protein ACREE6_11295 [Limisphaerales bacterium]